MDDLISRQAAIEAINTWDKFGVDERGRLVRWHEGLEPYVHLRDVLTAIINLPSAQPDIIRCEDCKWYGRADKRRFYRGMDCLQKRIDTIVPDRDFCSKAERRTDEWVGNS